MICGHLPQIYRMSFDAIILCSKHPLSVKTIKKGLNVKVKSAIITPQKNTVIDGVEISNNKKVEEVTLKARMISSSTKRRGSNNHHKFSYKINTGEIISDNKNKNYRRV